MMKLTHSVVAFGVRYSLFNILRFVFEVLCIMHRSFSVGLLIKAKTNHESTKVGKHEKVNLFFVSL